MYQKAKMFFLFSLIVGALTSGVSATSSLAPIEDVHVRLLSEGLTNQRPLDAFRPNDLITRGEAAKFVSQYGALLELENTYTECTFSDLDGYDESLIPHIYEACGYGLLKGSNGHFSPNANITIAQSITIVIRALNGFQDETGTPRYSEYYTIAKDYGLIQDEPLDAIATENTTRGDLGTRLYRAAQLHEDMQAVDILEEDPNDEEKEFMEDQEELEEKEYSTKKPPYGVVPYDDEAFTIALNTNQKVILYFYSSTCPLCKLLETDLLTRREDIQDDIVIFTINYETSTELNIEYGVSSEHTLVYLYTDGKVLGKTSKTATTLIDVLREMNEVSNTPSI